MMMVDNVWLILLKSCLLVFFLNPLFLTSWIEYILIELIWKCSAFLNYLRFTQNHYIPMQIETFAPSTAHPKEYRLITNRSTASPHPSPISATVFEHLLPAAFTDQQTRKEFNKKKLFNLLFIIQCVLSCHRLGRRLSFCYVDEYAKEFTPKPWATCAVRCGRRSKNVSSYSQGRDNRI